MAGVFGAYYISLGQDAQGITLTAEGAAISASAHARRYDIDALRVFAFGLLILFHVGTFYVLDWGWHVKSTYQAEWLQVPMMFANQWRMPLLFLISGLAVSFIWGKYSTGEFALRRIWRLFIPLLFGMAFIVSAQCYYEALNKGIIEPGYLTFMGQYLTFQDFPGEAWAGEEQIHWTWNHLWYLPYLLIYTLLLIPVGKFIDGPGKAVQQRFQGLRGIWMVLVPIVPIMIFHNLFYPQYATFSRALVDEWYILHQTIIVVVGFNLSRLQLGPVAEPALVLLATVGGCLLLHELVIRRVTFLRPFFGLKVTG